MSELYPITVYVDSRALTLLTDLEGTNQRFATLVKWDKDLKQFVLFSPLPMFPNTAGLDVAKAA